MDAMESPRATGIVAILAFDDCGRLKTRRDIKNLVVDSGRAFIAARITGDVPPMSHMAVGLASAPAMPLECRLGQEHGRVPLSASQCSDFTVTYIAKFPAGVGTGELTEAGIFDAEVDGTMLCRTSFEAVQKCATDAITVTWSVSIQA